MLLEKEIIDMTKELIVILYVSNQQKLYIYSNSLGLLTPKPNQLLQS